jgi:hypothetical protein
VWIVLYIIEIWKESLNTDGEYFHQYQQSKLKMIMGYGVRTLGLDLGQVQKRGGIMV